jgi:hypothetical protein
MTHALASELLLCSRFQVVQPALIAFFEFRRRVKQRKQEPFHRFISFHKRTVARQPLQFPNMNGFRLVRCACPSELLQGPQEGYSGLYVDAGSPRERGSALERSGDVCLADVPLPSWPALHVGKQTPYLFGCCVSRWSSALITRIKSTTITNCLINPLAVLEV